MFTDLFHERAYRSAAHRARAFASTAPDGSATKAYWTGFRAGMVAWQNAALGNPLTREQQSVLARLDPTHPAHATRPNVVDAARAAGFTDGRDWEYPARRVGLRRLLGWLRQRSVPNSLPGRAYPASPSVADRRRGTHDCPESELHAVLERLEAWR